MLPSYRTGYIYAQGYEQRAEAAESGTQIAFLSARQGVSTADNLDAQFMQNNMKLSTFDRTDK